MWGVSEAVPCARRLITRAHFKASEGRRYRAEDKPGCDYGRYKGDRAGLYMTLRIWSNMVL